jgi:hypothetical protein
MRTAALLAAPLLLVAAALVASLRGATTGPDDVDLDNYRLSTGKDCGMEGSPNGSEAQKALDRLKNRYHLPDDSDIDPQVSLVAMLAPGKDLNRFDQEKAAKVRGFVIEVKPGEKESCNCGAADLVDRDTHIELGLAEGVPETQRVIVEVTPRLRLLMKQKADWSTPALSKEYKGKWVEVTGWLTFDTAHIKQAENTNPGAKGNWRATCWEIHPVTAITPLEGPPDEAKEFKPSSFAALQGLHAARIARAPNGKATVEKMHRTALAKFKKEELKEAEEEAKERRKPSQ